MLKKIAHIFKPRDMTTGNIFFKIILFAIPAMLTTMMQLLYTTIDLTTVHYGDSAESMGAIASNTALINLIIVVFTGVSLGANVVLSEARESALLHADELQYAPDGRRTETQAEQSYSIYPAHSA